MFIFLEPPKKETRCYIGLAGVEVWTLDRASRVTGSRCHQEKKTGRASDPPSWGLRYFVVSPWGRFNSPVPGILIRKHSLSPLQGAFAR